MSTPKLHFYVRLLLPSLALVSVAALPAAAQRPNRVAQPRYRQARAASRQNSPLLTVHQTLRNAALIMERALPIYDGHRVRAMKLTHLAAEEIRALALGTSGPVAPGQTGTQRQTPAQRAALIPKGRNVAMSRYTAQQIATSNSEMQQGMQLLQQGLQQIQSLGQDPSNHLSDAAEFANLALQAANKGMQYVGHH